MMRTLLIILSTLALSLMPITAANAKQDIKHYKSYSAVSFKAAAAPVKKGGNQKFNSAYGWNWDGLVEVYDATGDPVWDVDGAVAKWNKAGINVVITTNRADAEIVVEEGDANAYCNTNQTIIGCGGSDVANGEPYQGKVVMNASWADWVYTDTLVGGTIHELGHTLGYGHPAGLTNADSVMGVPIPANGGATTILTPYDKSGVRYLY